MVSVARVSLCLSARVYYTAASVEFAGIGALITGNVVRLRDVLCERQ
jgi:hypothetical protein